MLFKMRILFYSKAGNSELMAQAISREQKAGCDKIPPAYPCEGEKLLFIGVEADKKKPEAPLADFCSNLTPQRCKNVAFFAIGSSFEVIDELKSIVKKNGVNVVENTYTCSVKGGLFKKGKVSDSDLAAAAKWSNEIVQSLAQ